MKFMYSIARYVPSIVRDEAINVGVFLEADSPRVLYVRFLSALSRVRTLFPDADIATLRLLRTHFSSEKPKNSSIEQMFIFSEPKAPALEALVRLCRDTTLQLSAPRVTIGTDPKLELAELFDRFVAPRAADAIKPISTVQLAPYALRHRVDNWLVRSGLLEAGKYQRQFELRGTVFPWSFDFGMRNGKVTVVQTLALRAPIEVAMNRALLFRARVDDVIAARHSDKPNFIVIADGIEKGSPPVKYLQEHHLEPVPAEDKVVKEVLHKQLVTASRA